MHFDDSSALEERTNVKTIIRHIDQLPSPPPVATKVLTEVLNGAADFAEISRLIETDQSLTLKILKIANSMAYGYRGKISTIESAVATIGLDTLKNALLSVIIRDSFCNAPEEGDKELVRIWKHTLATAVAASLLAERVRPELKGIAFAAGIVHDCGKLVLLTALPEDYEKLLNKSRETGHSILDLEQQYLGVAHTQVGKWLLQKWGLPQTLSDVTWLHHHSPEALITLGGSAEIAALLSLAGILAHEVMLDEPNQEHTQAKDALLAYFDLPAQELSAIIQRIGEGYADRAAMFNLKNDAALFYFEALQRANSVLSLKNAELQQSTGHLRRANALLEVIGDASSALGEMHDTWDVLNTVADIFRLQLNAREGFIHSLDTEKQCLRGIFWSSSENTEISLPLGQDGNPKTTGLDIPPRLAEALQTLSYRIPESGTPRPTRLSGAGPYCLAPLFSSYGFSGEIIFRPQRDGRRFIQEEHSGYLQLAQIVATTLERLAMENSLEQRAERLASTLGKLRRLNSKLVQTERLAAVGQLAAGAAHEINNPLAIIYARTQLMAHREKDDKKKHDFRQMMDQIERITSILKNLMDFARPTPPRIEATSLNALTRRTLSLVQGELTKNHIRLETAFFDALPDILGDASQLEQVLLNLIINSEHAIIERLRRPDMSNEDGLIHLTTALDKRQHKALVVLTDNGIGISQENLKKIFDPFFTTKEEGKGTGLGLSTSYGIIAGHDGEIHYDSREKAGTTVTITLPLAAEASAAVPNVQTASHDSAILVVDDEKHIREILKESLESRGYRVQTAPDGQTALQRLSQNRYRLMLLDLRMPSRDGFSLLEHARKHIQKMPVIILTGMAGPEEKQKALALGATRCVHKPFQIKALMDDIESLLREKIS